MTNICKIITLTPGSRRPEPPVRGDPAPHLGRHDRRAPAAQEAAQGRG
jgi:hypothetical protein